MTKKTPCLDYALHYLSRYPKTMAEMNVRLLEKGYAEQDIATAMAQLQKLGYIDDEAFVQGYIQSEIIRKGKPSYAIKAKLRHKGIDDGLIQRLYDEHHEEMKGGMQAAIIAEIDKRKKRGEDPLAIIQKLQRKGYHFGLIKETIEARDRGEIS